MASSHAAVSQWLRTPKRPFRSLTMKGTYCEEALLFLKLLGSLFMDECFQVSSWPLNIPSLHPRRQLFADCVWSLPIHRVLWCHLPMQRQVLSWTLLTGKYNFLFKYSSSYVYVSMCLKKLLRFCPYKQASSLGPCNNRRDFRFPRSFEMTPYYDVKLT